MEEKQKFRVGRAKIVMDGGELIDRYLILNDFVPDYRANEWIDLKSMSKLSTGREYAYKLTVFFNFLNFRNSDIVDAEVKDVLAFVIYAVYGFGGDSNVFMVNGKISYSTLCKYISVISGYYRWLNSVYGCEIQFSREKRKVNVNSFMYGQVWEYDYDDIIGKHIRNLKGSAQHIKWYTDETKRKLLNGFLNLRDKAIFLLTLEGFRIDEVLSIYLYGYDGEIVRPSRSKGRINNSDKIRTVVLSTETRKTLDSYIFSERSKAESESGLISQYIFINLKKGINQGKPLRYRAFWESLKACAKRCGIDESKIRTHSGRSTKVMEFLEQQALHPEKNITDALIMYHFGWSSLEPLKFYRDFDNKIIAKSAYDKLHKGEVDFNG